MKHGLISDKIKLMDNISVFVVEKLKDHIYILLFNSQTFISRESEV